MTEDEREEILRTAFENIAKRDDEAAELAERRERNLGHVHEDERARFERRRAARPPRPEPKLDTVPMINIDERIAALIETKIAAAIAAERETMIEIVAEAVALERRDNEAFLGKATAAFRADLSNLQNSLAELRDVLGNEARRTTEVQRARSLLDFPAREYPPRDLN
jgi:hypothetical protein